MWIDVDTSGYRTRQDELLDGRATIHMLTGNITSSWSTEGALAIGAILSGRRRPTGSERVSVTTSGNVQMWPTKGDRRVNTSSEARRR